MHVLCKKCGIEKPIEEFNKHISAGPLEPWNVRRCKDCAHDEYTHRYADKMNRDNLLSASRNWKKNNAARHSEINKRWAAKNKDKVRAKGKLNYAIRKGRIQKLPCEICGDDEKVHAHHDSYAVGKELDVRWLCGGHHMKWHQIMDELGEAVDLEARFQSFKATLTQGILK